MIYVSKLESLYACVAVSVRRHHGNLLRGVPAGHALQTGAGAGQGAGQAGIPGDIAGAAACHIYIHINHCILFSHHRNTRNVH